MQKKGSMHRNMDETAKEQALLLLKAFEKKIKSGKLSVETASYWQGMGKSATLRIDVSADSYEEYDDIPRT